MAKRKNLKQKLKAASRRRQQRAASSTQVVEAPSSSCQSVDVLGLLIQAIVHHTVDGSKDNSDAMIVAALRSSSKGTQPTGESARALHSAFAEISNRDDVKQSVFRKSIESLLKSASDQQEADSDDAFRKYLHVLVS